jgi:hypothetical protein
MRFRYLNFLVALALASTLSSAAQQRTAHRETHNSTRLIACFGKEMFMSYCASCQGKDATGDGPAASALD